MNEKCLTQIMKELEWSKKVLLDYEAEQKTIEKAVSLNIEGCKYLRDRGYHYIVKYYETKR